MTNAKHLPTFLMPTTIQRRCSFPADYQERLATANVALEYFAPGTTLEFVRGRFIVCFTSRGNRTRKHWKTSGQDFFPVWRHSWRWGYTACKALSQLVRWIQGRPVVPLGQWRSWSGDSAFLSPGVGPDLVGALAQGGYPESSCCVLCGRDLASARIDWWSRDGVSGPCCLHTDIAGCGQKVRDDR